MAAARRVAQAVRSMLPDSSTTEEDEDLEEADADEMRALQVRRDLLCTKEVCSVLMFSACAPGLFSQTRMLMVCICT